MENKARLSIIDTANDWNKKNEVESWERDYTVARYNNSDNKCVLLRYSLGEDATVQLHFIKQEKCEHDWEDIEWIPFREFNVHDIEKELSFDEFMFIVRDMGNFL